MIVGGCPTHAHHGAPRVDVEPEAEALLQLVPGAAECLQLLLLRPVDGGRVLEAPVDALRNERFTRWLPSRRGPRPSRFPDRPDRIGRGAGRRAGSRRATRRQRTPTPARGRRSSTRTRRAPRRRRRCDHGRLGRIESGRERGLERGQALPLHRVEDSAAVLPRADEAGVTRRVQDHSRRHSPCQEPTRVLSES